MRIVKFFFDYEGWTARKGVPRPSANLGDYPRRYWLKPLALMVAAAAERRLAERHGIDLASIKAKDSAAREALKTAPKSS